MCLAFILTEVSRIRLAMVLMFFSICGTSVSKLLILAGYHLLMHLHKYFVLVETYDGTLMPIWLICSGVYGLIVNAFGIYLYFRSLYPLQRSRLFIQIFWHVSLSGVFFVLTFCLCLLCLIHSLRVDNSFRGGLQPMMRIYRSNNSIKSRIDDLQAEYKCCGSEGYTDWFHLPWIPDAFINANDPDVRLRLRNGIYESDDVPYSCCNPKAPRPCIDAHVHDDTKHFNYFHSKDLTLFHDGCRDVLKENFIEKVIGPVLGICSVLCGISMLVVILARYLQTSMVGALDLGNPTAEARGYTCQCCLFITEEVLNMVMRPDPNTPTNENKRPSVPAMCGQPPRPWISTSNTKS